MYCVNCGKQLSETARFCSYCGSKVGEVVAPAAEPTATPAASTLPDLELSSTNDYLEELIRDLTVGQCSIDYSEELSSYHIKWKDAIHAKDCVREDIVDFGTEHLVEGFDIRATPSVLADIYDALESGIESTPSFQGSVLLCGLEDWGDVLCIVPNDNDEFPPYSVEVKSFVDDGFSYSVNTVLVHRLEGFRIKKEGVAAPRAGLGRGSRQDWANSVQALIHSALSGDLFMADVMMAADYLSGDAAQR